MKNPGKLNKLQFLKKMRQELPLNETITADNCANCRAFAQFEEIFRQNPRYKHAKLLSVRNSIGNIKFKTRCLHYTLEMSIGTNIDLGSLVRRVEKTISDKELVE